jgi:transposase
MDRSDRLKLRSAGSIARSIHWTPKNGTTLKNGRLVVWESSRAKNSRAAQPEANSQGEAARRSSRKGVWVGLFQALAQADGPADQVLLDSSAVKAHRSAAGGKGGKNQAIGRSRGGRSTKIHALTDAQCRPLAFMLTGGQVADCTSGALLLEQLPDYDIQHADKGYDANAPGRGAWRDAEHPAQSQRNWKNCFSPFLYRNRNAIERMFCRLKDFRRIATRYDRSATNFLAAVCIAAAICY